MARRAGMWDTQRCALVAAAALLAALGCRSEKSEPAKERWYRAVLDYGESGGVPFFVSLPSVGSSEPAVIKNGGLEVQAQAARSGSLVQLSFPVYSTTLTGTIAPDGRWSGRLERSAPGWFRISTPFVGTPVASPDPALRFPEATGTGEGNVAGRWRITIDDGEGVLWIRRSGSVLDAQLDAPRGGHIYLTGNMGGGRLWLSSFDGQFGYLVRGAVEGEKISGEWSAGPGTIAPFTGVRDEGAAAPSPVHARTEAERLKLPELLRPPYAGRPVVLELAGSWCPHCNEAAPFFRALHARYHPRGVEFLTLVYEFTEDKAYNRDQAARFQKTHGIPWSVVPVHGAIEDFYLVMPEGLEGLDVSGFPFTVFVRRDGTVRSAHAGYASPASPQLHERFAKHVHDEIEAILADPTP